MIDISALTAAELEELIAQAVTRRSTMQPPIPGERPQEVQALMNPAWYVTLIPEGTLFQIAHAGFGWLAFIIPKVERLLLMSLLLQHSLLSAESIIPPAGSGGKPH